jgi:hypothetical protein
MKIKGWEKISGFTYKGYCIVNPMHNAGEDTYYATIDDLNHVVASTWDIKLTSNDNTGVITFRILDSATQHLMAKSHLTKPNISTLQKFRVEYEMLIDDILEQRQSYVKNVTRNINSGTTGIINQVQNAGTAVTYSIAPKSGIGMLPKSGSVSIPLTNMQRAALQALKDLQEQMDKLNAK